MEDDEVLSLNRPESQSTNPPGHLWRDKWTTFTRYTLHQVVYTPEDVATALGLLVPRK
jgi:hypothetical protein